MGSLNDLIRPIKFIAFDFDGVFTDNAVYTFEDGREAVRSWRGDGFGLALLKVLGIDPVIITEETNRVVLERALKLGVPCIQAAEGQKLALLTRCKEGLDWSQVAYLGNDVNDLDCLKAVGLPMVVRDAHSAVRPYARYVTRAAGGYGAVREVCDLFAEVLRG